MSTNCNIVRQRFNAVRAVRAQTILSKLVSTEDSVGDIRRVAGVDVSYVKIGELELGVGVVVLLDYPELKPRRCLYTVRRVCIPYIPGLLAFREMEVLAPVLAYTLHEENVDLLVVDGHGIAHPRGFGIASHLGLAFNKPSIGVAKNLLAGREEQVGDETYIVLGGRVVGVTLTTGQGKLYVSPGHRVSVRTALQLVKSMLKPGSRLPEPTRLADMMCKELKSRWKRELPEVRECTVRSIRDLLDHQHPPAKST